MDRHDRMVRDIADAVARFREQGVTPTITHGSTNSTRPRSDLGEGTIDIGGLDRVLEVDEDAQQAVVEPNVPMDRLVDATLEHGLVPPVVMEFPGITVGGGIQGGAGESSSFRHGAFHQTFDRYELVLGDGEVVEASGEENGDLFRGTACSYGSLGVLTRARLDLVPATRYVTLEYRRVGGAEEAVEEIRRAAAGDADFVDGILFGPDRGVVMVGWRSDEKVGPVRRFRRRTDEWFYLHARRVSEERERHVESVPLRDYLFRYDRGAFWMGERAFRRFNIPFNRYTRALLDPMFRTRDLYDVLHAGDLARWYIIQDLCLPGEEAVGFIDWVDRELGIYPLWLCPLRAELDIPLSPTTLDTDLVINVGVWGNPGREDMVAANRDVEREVLDRDGIKVLYAHQYFPEDEFWEMFDRAAYDVLREKYRGDTFRDVYRATQVEHLPVPSVARATGAACRAFLPR